MAVFDLHQLCRIQSASSCCISSERQPLLTEVFVLVRCFLRFWLPLAHSPPTPTTERLAEMCCVSCHIVSPTERRDVTDAPPFEAIARNFASNPDTLAFSIIDPHPRMNVTLTRREAQDVAAYINTLAK
jgi:hypothetical protein